MSVTLKPQAVEVLLSLSALDSAERVTFLSSGGQGQLTCGNPLTFELSTGGAIGLGPRNGSK